MCIFLKEPEKANDELIWNLNNTSFEDFARMMVEYDMSKFQLKEQMSTWVTWLNFGEEICEINFGYNYGY